MCVIGEARIFVAKESSQNLWRSLEELAGTREFEEALHREFPRGASEWPDDGVSRRRFLKLMGASLALAGVYGCSKEPEEKIVPYVNPPAGVVPGKALYFATAMTMGGYGMGLLVESHLGRPTKAEGNPDHPASLGATNVFGQACLLDLYDPDRSSVVTYRSNITDWGAFSNALAARMENQRSNGGAGLRILTSTVTSPTLIDQMQQVLRMYPKARWHRYDPVGRGAGSTSAVYRLDRAEVVLSLDSDFLFDEPGSVRYGREFIDKRRVRDARGTMNRLYVVEPTPTITGSMADHRLAVRAGEVEAIAREVATEIGIAQAATSSARQKWVTAVAEDLGNHRGSSLVIAGPYQSPAVHRLAEAMNLSLGNVGSTFLPIDNAEAAPAASLEELIADMDSGTAEVLIILGGNPAYNAPANLKFAEALTRFSMLKNADGSFRNMSVRLGLHNDETSLLCQWHVPEKHFLESWSDVRAFDGTVSLVQPLIAPLYPSKSDHEMLAAIMGDDHASDHDLVQQYWNGKHGPGDFDAFWRATLEKGIIGNTASAYARALGAHPAPASESSAPKSESGLEIVFLPDPSIWDGAFANNPWLQELPKPFSKLTWDNAANISPTTARQMGLNNGDVVTLRYQGQEVEAPVYVLPGQADGSVTVHLGYGRTRAGSVGNGVGFNAYALRSSRQPWFDSGLTITKTGRTHLLAVTHDHHTIESRSVRGNIRDEVVSEPTRQKQLEQEELDNRRLVRVAELEFFRQHPSFAKEVEGEAAHKPLLSLFPGQDYSEGYKWGMSIDINACIGCNACVVACQAENNIPVVGKDQVIRGREMHWLRIDQYYRGEPENPEMYNQPVPCMHCENAPCELVCPVGATVHDSEGINNMVYNRCIGTRYCSNNCPYKVRRFNFFDYRDTVHPTIAMQKNPEVTVRSRGVMEKCSYCIQRITNTRIEAEKQGRRIKDGEVQTACQQACPTRAIIFGDLNDRGAEVVKLKALPMDYGILEELTTKPRTTYLARLRNSNPALTPTLSRSTGRGGEDEKGAIA